MQALKLSSSQAAMISIGCGVVVGLMVSQITGCGAVVGPEGVAARAATVANGGTTSSPSIDAGIMFADQANYLCVPLSRLGISSADEVLAVNSSCECTRPSIIEYQETRAQSARALRVDFEPEPGMAGSQAAPMNLAVEVSLELGAGRRATATIQFLHTQVVAAGLTQGADE